MLFPASFPSLSSSILAGNHLLPPLPWPLPVPTAHGPRQSPCSKGRARRWVLRVHGSWLRLLTLLSIPRDTRHSRTSVSKRASPISSPAPVRGEGAGAPHDGQQSPSGAPGDDAQMSDMDFAPCSSRFRSPGLAGPHATSSKFPHTHIGKGKGLNSSRGTGRFGVSWWDVSGKMGNHLPSLRLRAKRRAGA